MVPYEVALTAVFVEGFVFVGLTVLGIRQWLARYVIPISCVLRCPCFSPDLYRVAEFSALCDAV